MGDHDEGDVPYEGRFCKCGLKESDEAWELGGRACPDCKRVWPENMVTRYPYDGKPQIRTVPGQYEKPVAAKRPVLENATDQELRNELDRRNKARVRKDLEDRAKNDMFYGFMLLMLDHKEGGIDLEDEPRLVTLLENATCTDMQLSNSHTERKATIKGLSNIHHKSYRFELEIWENPG